MSDKNQYAFLLNAISDPNSRVLKKKKKRKYHFSLQSACQIIWGCLLIIIIYISQWYCLAFYKTEEGILPGIDTYDS